MFEKSRALIRTMRPMTWVSIMITLFTGLMISWGGVPPLKDSILISVVLPILVAGYANSLNAYTDYKIDEITRPQRAIPKGVLKRETVLYFSLFLFLITIVYSAFVIHFALFEFVAAGLLISTLYSLRPPRIKARGVAAPLAIAAGYVFIPLVGASSHYTELTYSALFVAIVLTAQTAGASISKDLVDMKGDNLHHMDTLPLTLGMGKVRYIILSGLGIPLVFPVLSSLRILPGDFYLFLVLVPWLFYISLLTKNESVHEKVYIHSFFFCAASILLSGIAYTGGIP